MKASARAISSGSGRACCAWSARSAIVPRCLAVCPVGNDYHAHLAEPAEGDSREDAREGRAGQAVQGRPRRAESGRRRGPWRVFDDWNARWVGPDGYQGMVARQMQDFKAKQKQRADLQRPARADPPSEQAADDAWESSRRPLTAGDIKAQGDRARRRSRRHRRRRDARCAIRPIRPTRQRPSRHHRSATAAVSSSWPRRLSSGVARIMAWDDRHKYYNDELALTLARGDLARSGLLARGRGLSGGHRPADPRRPLALPGRPGRST